MDLVHGTKCNGRLAHHLCSW